MNMLNDGEIWPPKYISYFWIKRWSPCFLIPIKHPVMSMKWEVHLSSMKWQWLSVLSKEYVVEESLHPLRKRVLKVDNIEGGYKRKKNNF